MCALHSGREMRGARRDPREETEGTVDVQPAAIPLGEIGETLDRIEVAGGHLTGVSDDDRRRAAQRTQRGFERGEVDAADIVAREPTNRVTTAAEHRERLCGAGMDVATREHRNGRAARETG